MREYHGKADCHAGLSNLRYAPRELQGLNGRICCADRDNEVVKHCERNARACCASRFARKSSAMCWRLIVTRIIPIITIQIMAKTRSSSARMSTTLNRYRQTAFATLSSIMAMRSAPSSVRVANAAIRAVRSAIAGGTGTRKSLSMLLRCQEFDVLQI